MSSTKQSLGRTQPTPHRVVSEIRKRYVAAGGTTPFDRVYAFDGKADVIRCGGGIDRVVVDAKDKVSVSCEKVLVRT